MDCDCGFDASSDSVVPHGQAKTLDRATPCGPNPTPDARHPIPDSPRRRKVRATGFVLVLVIGFAAVVTVTGVAFLEANSTAMPQAANLRAMARATYLAESGVAMAAHYLRVPPSTVTAGNYWSGVSGFSVDGSATDYCDITVTRSVSRPETYTVAATGVACDGDGTVRSRQTVTAEIVTPPPKGRSYAKSFVGLGNQNLPASAKFYGDVHVNGNISSNAYCIDRISATGTITWSDSNTPSSITQFAPSVTPPPMTYAAWSDRYVVHGVVHQPATLTAGTLTVLTMTGLGGWGSLTVYLQPTGAVIVDSSATLLGGLGGLGASVQVVASSAGLTGTAKTGASMVSASNPGGIVVRNGDLTISTAATFIGTLVVNGDLNISLAGLVTIVALPGYPALVVADDITLGPLANLEVRGPILLGDRCQGGLATLNTYGVYIGVSQNAVDNSLSSNTRIRYDSSQSTVYDFSSSAVQPMTLVSWDE